MNRGIGGRLFREPLWIGLAFGSAMGESLRSYAIGVLAGAGITLLAYLSLYLPAQPRRPV